MNETLITNRTGCAIVSLASAKSTYINLNILANGETPSIVRHPYSSRYLDSPQCDAYNQTSQLEPR